MSQEKVNRYKEEKANRKKNLMKQKKQKTLKTIGGILASILLIVAIIFSAKVLRGDFQEEVTSTYSPEYLQQISSLFSNNATTTSATTVPLDNTSGTTASEETTTAPTE